MESVGSVGFETNNEQKNQLFEFSQNLDELPLEKTLKQGHKPYTPTQPNKGEGFSLTLDSTPPAPPTPPDLASQQPAVLPPRQLAAIILGCKTWVAALEAMDAVAQGVGKQRQIVFTSVLKRIPNKEDRQHLVKLLAEHIRQFPRDYWAYNWLPSSCHQLKEKAISLACGVTGIKDVGAVEET